MICICADDVGLYPGIGRAVLRLVAAQRVGAMSVMVGGEDLAGLRAELRALDPQQVDIGLHLDLTAHPMRIESRRSLGAWIAASLLRRADRDALRAEICCQLDAFEQMLGRAPDFVDGHQHVHQLPMVRDALVAELSDRDPGRAVWLRSTRAPRGAATPAFKPRVIECLGAKGLAALARAHGLAQNRHLLGVYDFAGGAGRYRRLLRDWLRAAETADLLMCHPGSNTGPRDTIGAARQAEYEVLAGDDFGRLLHDQGITLQPMSRILALMPPATGCAADGAAPRAPNAAAARAR